MSVLFSKVGRWVAWQADFRQPTHTPTSFIIETQSRSRPPSSGMHPYVLEPPHLPLYPVFCFSLLDLISHHPRCYVTAGSYMTTGTRQALKWEFSDLQATRGGPCVRSAALELACPREATRSCADARVRTRGLGRWRPRGLDGFCLTCCSLLRSRLCSST